MTHLHSQHTLSLAISVVALTHFLILIFIFSYSFHQIQMYFEIVLLPRQFCGFRGNHALDLCVYTNN